MLNAQKAASKSISSNSAGAKKVVAFAKAAEKKAAALAKKNKKKNGSDTTTTTDTTTSTDKVSTGASIADKLKSGDLGKKVVSTLTGSKDKAKSAVTAIGTKKLSELQTKKQ